MTETRRYVIECDACEATFWTRNPYVLRSAARKKGWTVSDPLDRKGRDLCPRCAADELEQARVSAEIAESREVQWRDKKWAPRRVNARGPWPTPGER